MAAAATIGDPTLGVTDRIYCGDPHHHWRLHVIEHGASWSRGRGDHLWQRRTVGLAARFSPGDSFCAAHRTDRYARAAAQFPTDRCRKLRAAKREIDRHDELSPRSEPRVRAVPE